MIHVERIARTETGGLYTSAEAAGWASVALASIDGTADTVDATVIANLIPRALSWLERLVRRTLLTSTIKVTFDLEDLLKGDRTYRRELHFDDTLSGACPVVPLVSVQSVKTTDKDGVQSTMAVTDYWVYPDEVVGRIALRDGVSWPSNLRPQACVEVALTAGFGAAAAVPGEILTAGLEYITFEYRNPGTGMAQMPAGGAMTAPRHPHSIALGLEDLGWTVTPGMA